MRRTAVRRTAPAQVRPRGLGQDDRCTGELHQPEHLGEVSQLRTRSPGVAAVQAWPPRQRQVRDRARWPQEPTEVSAAQVLEVVHTNVVGVIRVTNAVLPLLRRAPEPRIVNVSSTVGSLTPQTRQAEAVGPISAAYSRTKTYLNAVTIQYAKELAGTGILVNAGCPGYVSTDLNGHRGHRTPEQGAAVFLEIATLPAGGPSGTFRDEEGIQPW